MLPKTPRALVGVILPVLASTLSLVGAIVILVERLHFSLALVLSLASTAAAFIVGMLSSTIARGARRISGKRQVFLSYDKSVTPEALSIARSLSDAGLRVWTGNEMLKPGDHILEAIKKAIEESDRFVVVLADSPSPWQGEELAFAMARHLKIIPVLVRGARVPTSLSDIRAINLQEKPEAGLRELLQATA